MADKKEKEYICAYKYCLHHGQRVKRSESVVLGNRHYHWDCAGMKQEIKDCVDLYMNCIDDKTQFPVAYKIINILVQSCIILKNLYRYYMELESYFLKKSLHLRR